MKVETNCKSKLIIKRVSGSQYLFNHIQTSLNDYMRWLSNAGFATPKTVVSYNIDTITFTQEKIIGGKTRNIDRVIVMLQQLDLSTYGVDANPGNFLGQNDIYFVDFFPFLVRNNRIIAEQFDYNITEVYQRYFTISNILLCLINRTFKSNPTKARHTLISMKNRLFSDYNQLLPRDKLRLLRALTVDESETKTSFSEFYTLSKDINSINPEDDAILINLLRKIT